MTKSILKIAGEVISKNKTKILTGLTIAGIYGTAFLSSKATLKANEILLKTIDDPSKLKLIDKVKLTWKEYIPAGLVSIGAVLCLLQNNRFNRQEQTALLALLSLANARSEQYQKKVTELFGEGQNLKIKDAISRDQIINNPPKEILITGPGDILCFDMVSGRYFKSNAEKIRRKENEINQRLRSEMMLSLNELYYELGLPPTKLGDIAGFNIENDIITIHYSSQLTDDQTPCLVINYDVIPLF